MPHCKNIENMLMCSVLVLASKKKKKKCVAVGCGLRMKTQLNSVGYLVQVDHWKTFCGLKIHKKHRAGIVYSRLSIS